METTVTIAPVFERKSPAVAMIWSIALAGLGQFYNGDSQKGGAFLIAAILYWIVFWPLWIPVSFWSIYDAYSRANEINSKIDLQEEDICFKEAQVAEINSTRTKVADFIGQAKKLNGLFVASVFSEEEYRNKIAVLITSLGEKLPYEGPEDFLTALVPHVASGVFDAHEIAKIKSLVYI